MRKPRKKEPARKKYKFVIVQKNEDVTFFCWVGD